MRKREATKLFDKDYTEEVVDKIYKMIANGDTIYQAARECKISVPRIKRWRLEYKEFDSLLEEAEDYARGWYDSIGKENLTNIKFNTILYQYMRRQRFQESENPKIMLDKLAASHDIVTSAQVIRESVSCGKISIREASELMNIIKEEALILEVHHNKKILDELKESKL